MKKKRRWVGYLVTVLIAVAMAAGVFISRGGLTLTAREDILGALCDGFFVPACTAFWCCSRPCARRRSTSITSTTRWPGRPAAKSHAMCCYG